MILPALIMIVMRKDLLIDAIATEILLTTVGIAIYLLLHLTHPGYVDAIWSLNQKLWYAKTILGIPIAEYLFYFASGMFIGPFYEYWLGYTLVTIKQSGK